jgi:hypothetical protein
MSPHTIESTKMIDNQAYKVNTCSRDVESRRRYYVRIVMQLTNTILCTRTQSTFFRSDNNYRSLYIKHAIIKHC